MRADDRLLLELAGLVLGATAGALLVLLLA